MQSIVILVSLLIVAVSSSRLLGGDAAQPNSAPAKVVEFTIVDETGHMCDGGDVDGRRFEAPEWDLFLFNDSHELEGVCKMSSFLAASVAQDRYNEERWLLDRLENRERFETSTMLVARTKQAPTLANDLVGDHKKFEAKLQKDFELARRIDNYLYDNWHQLRMPRPARGGAFKSVMDDVKEFAMELHKAIKADAAAQLAANQEKGYDVCRTDLNDFEQALDKADRLICKLEPIMDLVEKEEGLTGEFEGTEIVGLKRHYSVSVGKGVLHVHSKSMALDPNGRPLDEEDFIVPLNDILIKRVIGPPYATGPRVIVEVPHTARHLRQEAPDWNVHESYKEALIIGYPSPERARVASDQLRRLVLESIHTTTVPASTTAP